LFTLMPLFGLNAVTMRVLLPRACSKVLAVALRFRGARAVATEHAV